MKAQQFFGGTKPKETGVKTRQVGNTGSVKNFTGSMPNLHENVKQARPSPATPHIKWVDSKQVGSTGRDA